MIGRIRQEPLSVIRTSESLERIANGLSNARNARLANMEVFPGISMDPDVRFGKPCLTGTRIDVATIVGALAAGESADAVASEYSLSVDQVRSALAYVAHV